MNIHLENDCLQIGGASKIVSCTENMAVVEVDQTSVVVNGSEIEVKKLNLDEGQVVLSGKFAVIKFTSSTTKKQPFFKRLLK